MYLTLFFRLVVPESVLVAKNSCTTAKMQFSGSNLSLRVALF